MGSDMDILGLKATPGSRVRGSLNVGPYFHHRRASYTGRHVIIPFTIVRGTKDGPILVHLSGCHPAEYAGIEATIRLSNEIRPENLRGTFIAVPCINTPGFPERSYVNPIDGINIQERYPGKLDGTISDLIAYRVFHDIVLRANYSLEAHGSDVHESNPWSFIFYGTGDEVEKESEAIGKATGLKYIRRMVRPGALGMEAAKHGIPGGLYELGSGDVLCPEESSAIMRCTLNAMRYLRMIEGTPEEIKNQPGTIEGQEQEIWNSSVSVHFKVGGLYHSRVTSGGKVMQGEVIGTITDFWGEVVETLHAPVTGRVGLMTHSPVANPGETAMTIYF